MARFLKIKELCQSKYFTYLKKAVINKNIQICYKTLIDKAKNIMAR